MASSDEFAKFKREQARAYLERVARCVQTCDMLRSEIDELSDMDVRALDYSAQGAKRSADPDRIARIVARRDELREAYADELESELQAKADAHRVLARVEQPARAALTYRYVQGMEWRDVAKRMQYTCDGLMKLHRRALEALYDAMRVELPAAI